VEYVCGQIDFRSSGSRDKTVAENRSVTSSSEGRGACRLPDPLRCPVDDLLDAPDNRYCVEGPAEPGSAAGQHRGYVQ
jgi:hypothetical protein